MGRKNILKRFLIRQQELNWLGCWDEFECIRPWGPFLGQTLNQLRSGRLDPERFKIWPVQAKPPPPKVKRHTNNSNLLQYGHCRQWCWAKLNFGSLSTFSFILVLASVTCLRRVTWGFWDLCHYLDLWEGDISGISESYEISRYDTFSKKYVYRAVCLWGAVSQNNLLKASRRWLFFTFFS